jgi:N-acetylneuraminate lyase
MNTPMPLRLRGLIAAPHTPMHADGSVNVTVVPRQVEILLAGKVSAAFICGTTGEGPSLSTAERMQLAESWMAAAPPELPMIVHVGHASIAEARALAAHAQRIGAAAVAALAPFFFRPSGVPALVDFCARVASAADRTPFYYYHLPSMTGVSLSVTDFFGQARKAIPTFAGIKYTHDNLMEFQQLVAMAGDELDVLFGRDEILLAGLAAGAKGAIGSTYNYAAPVYHRIIAAVSAGDLATARKEQARAVRLVEVLRKFGEIPAAKAILTMLGVGCGPPRSPLTALSAQQLVELRREVVELGDVLVREVG